MNYKVIDNFLPDNEFNAIKNIVMSTKVPWYFQSNINTGHSDKDNTCYFTHSLWNWGHFPDMISHHFIDFKFLCDRIELKSLIRMKLNCYPRTDKIEIHKEHTDYSYNHKGCILSFNTCDGATIIFDENNKPIKIDSIENRALFFNPSLIHSSTSCTNAKARFNVNINYF